MTQPEDNSLMAYRFSPFNRCWYVKSQWCQRNSDIQDSTARASLRPDRTAVDSAARPGSLQRCPNGLIARLAGTAIPSTSVLLRDYCATSAGNNSSLET